MKKLILIIGTCILTINANAQSNSGETQNESQAIQLIAPCL